MLPERMDTGSPPRVRGTACYGGGAGCWTRITPARAGNSWQYTRFLRFTTDHPRACGEQNASTILQYSREGSPPRVRGTVHIVSPSPIWMGITPARAGNSFTTHSHSVRPRDHPRACGEQLRSNRSWFTP